ncbi:MAG TPA: hypothetical protein VG347_05880 [Verrucomicrobiae bacterium]|nr:hypothetical protein [Verrucomicrobiae bacterium]
MTPRQRITLQADWWPAACRVQGWNVKDRDLRMRVCMWAVSLENPTQLTLLEAINSDRQPARWLESTNDLDAKGDVDRVKACLGMLADRLRETAEVGQPQFGSARRKRDIIRAHLKCLGLYEVRPRRFLAHLVADMFATHLGPDVTIQELTDDGGMGDFKGRKPSDLHRLLMRLAQIVNDKRKGNVLVSAYRHLQGCEPLTIHEMKLTAGVQCDCAECNKVRTGAILPPLEENWSDFEPEIELAEAGPDGEEGDPF